MAEKSINRAEELTELMSESSRTGVSVERLREIRADVAARGETSPEPVPAERLERVLENSFTPRTTFLSPRPVLSLLDTSVPLAGQKSLGGEQASRPLTEKQVAQRAVMAERQSVKAERAQKIVAAGLVSAVTKHSWLVQSAPGSEAHSVTNPDGVALTCDCYDFTRYGGGVPCKHVLAVGLAVDKSQGEKKSISPDGSQRETTRARSGGQTMAAKKTGKGRAPAVAPAEASKKGDYQHPACVRCGEINTRKSGSYTTTDGTKSQIWHCNACGFTWREGSERKGKGTKKAPSAPARGERPVVQKKGVVIGAAAPARGPIVVAPPGTPRAGAGVIRGKIGGASAVVKKK